MTARISPAVLWTVPVTCFINGGPALWKSPERKPRPFSRGAAATCFVMDFFLPEKNLLSFHSAKEQSRLSQKNPFKQVERGELAADTFMGQIADMSRALVKEHHAPDNPLRSASSGMSPVPAVSIAARRESSV